MKRPGMRLIASGLAVLALGACFDDPTSALRNGPARIELSVVSLSVESGDSVSVEGRVLDEQGNPLPFSDANWTTADAATATTIADPNVAVGGVYSRVFVKGISAQGGVTTVTLNAQGLQQTFTVKVIPAEFSGTVAVTGTTSADTVLVPGAPGAAPDTTFIVAGDTLVLTAPATFTFDAAASQVNFGLNPGYIIERTATSMKVMSRGPFAGQAQVTNLIFTGTAGTGPINIDSIPTPVIQISRARFNGGIAVGNSAFGTNTQITVTAQAGTTFNTTGATASGVQVGSTTATVLTRTTTTLTAIVAGNLTQTVRVTNVNLGTALIDSLRTAGTTTVNASFFPGTVVNGAGAMLDTIVINGGGIATFTTTGATASNVTVNGTAAWVISRSANEVRAIARANGTSAVSVSNVLVAGTTISSLTSQNSITVGPATGDNEPANDSHLTAAVVTLPFAATPADSVNALAIFGVTEDGDTDLIGFTLAAPANVRLRLEWPTTGDVDLLMRNSTNTGFVGGFGGASLANPEVMNVLALPAGTYFIRVDGYDVSGAIVPFRIRAWTN